MPAQELSLLANNNFLNTVCQFEIPVRNPFCIMGGKPDIKGIVDIVPLRVVILGFTLKGDPGHYGESVLKIFKFKGSLNGAIYIIPPIQFLQSFFYFCFR